MAEALPLTIPHAAEAAARRWGNELALIEGSETRTFAQLWQECRAAASGFLAAGIKPGERVAIWAPNRREWVVGAVAAQICGAAVVPLNTRLKGREAGDILRRTHARMLLTVGDFLGIDYLALLADEGQSVSRGQGRSRLEVLARELAVDASGLSRHAVPCPPVPAGLAYRH